ncbi:hypothetical protein [Streptomyces lydicus]|uniref:hypothetical protein n=1 Tax=Streptomyces lydicus TaxID=47763 RepID=UPI0036E8E697
MTTYLSPSPPHGERARYLRGCRCTKCVDANKRYCKRYQYERHTRGPRRVDATAVTAEVQRLAKTWSHNQIAAASGCSGRVIFNLIHGQLKNVSRTSERRLLRAHMALAHQPGAALVDAEGTTRRGRALVAFGYDRTYLAGTLQMHVDAVGRLLNGKQQLVSSSTAQAMSDAYQQLASTPGPSNRARMRAAGLQWAPPWAWDDDTIDDPNAHPDWTGHCGTDRGYHLHKAEHIPMCTPCEEAHQQWLADHQHLKGAELRSVIIRARGQASGRGAALAENARELLAQELSWEAISTRLGADQGQIAAALRKYQDQDQGHQQMGMAA